MQIIGLIKTLFFAILIYYGWKILVKGFKAYSLFSEIKRNHTQNQNQNPYANPTSNPKPQSKSHTRDDGEYVDYEEIS